jgi:dTDP-4-dehydrorhamnose 3,5-epimerase
MKFVETALDRVYVVEIEPAADERGFFARTWSSLELRERGLNPALAECSVSGNRRKGTLRGLHYQRAPHEEAKLVRCTQGAIFDVAVDLRPSSPSFRRWVGVELSAENRRALYVPEGCAHGFQTLMDDTEVLYQISVPYVPAATAGVRWDDPAFGVAWPLPPSVMTERDRGYADYVDPHDERER